MDNLKHSLDMSLLFDTPEDLEAYGEQPKTMEEK